MTLYVDYNEQKRINVNIDFDFDKMQYTITRQATRRRVAFFLPLLGVFIVYRGKSSKTPQKQTILLSLIKYTRKQFKTILGAF